MTTPSDINRIEVTVEDDLINVSIAGTDAVNVSGTNIGGGAEIFKDKQSTVMRYRTITAGSGSTVAQTGNTVEIGVDTDVIASKTYVTQEINNLINGAPGALDTLNELAQAMANDPNFATTITNELALKASTADLAEVAFTGDYGDLINKPSIPASLLDLSINDGTSGQVLTTNGSGQFTFTSQVGPQGPQGIQGPAGIQGIQGIPGPKGDTGENGNIILPLNNVFTGTNTFQSVLIKQQLTVDENISIEYKDEQTIYKIGETINIKIFLFWKKLILLL